MKETYMWQFKVKKGVDAVHFEDLQRRNELWHRQ